jgi:hypothetical protein
MTTDAQLFDAARSAIAQVVKDDGLTIPLNETETRTHLVDPILIALGYRTLDQVRREYRLAVSGQVIDYLLTAGTQRVIVEAKSAGIELAQKEGGQLVGYAAQEGIRWALLTNGFVWQVFDIEATGNWELKKVAEFDLRAAYLNGSLAEALIPLSHFARQTLEIDDSALRAYVFEERVRTYLDSALRDPDSSLVRAMVSDMTAAGIVVSPEDVINLVRRGTMGPTSPVPVQVSPPPPTAIAEPNASYPTSSEPAFYLFPAGEDSGYPGLDHLKLWLSKGFWGVRPSTPHRSRLKAGDRCCFYATGVGVVATATLIGPATVPVSVEEWPGPGPHSGNSFKVPLTEIHWLQSPQPITQELREQLDAFAGKDLSRPWSWFVQSTGRLSKHDFTTLVR